MGDAQLFIDGAWVDAQSGETFPTYAPSTGEKITDVAKAGREDAQRAVEAARRAFDEGPWPKMSGKERAEKLRQVAEIITARSAEIAEIEARDGGGTIKKAMFADVPGVRRVRRERARRHRPRREPVPSREERRAPRAVRRVQRHRPVELPVPHGGLEDRARDRSR
jgi:acyl-CoA reductase-like NAD-dependent aldehyde dehydrogenase